MNTRATWARVLAVAIVVGASVAVLLLPGLGVSAPTLQRVESDAAVGTPVTSHSMPSGRMGQTVTTTERFRAVHSGAVAAWSTQATMAANLTSGANTMPATAIWAERSPFTGTFTSLGTTYRSLQSAIPVGTTTSGYFRLRAIIPYGQASGTYTGTLRVKTNDGTDSNIVDIALTIQVTDTLDRLEINSNPGTHLASYAMPSGIMGESKTTTDTFRMVINGSTVAWAAQARMAANLTGPSGTLAATAIYAERSPFTGTFTSLGTTFRSLQSGIPAGTLNSGYFRLRVIVPARTASGTYSGSLEVRVSGAGTSHVKAVPITVTVVDTLNRLEDTTSPGGPAGALNLGTGRMGDTLTSSKTYRGVLNGTPTAAWTIQASMAANLTDGVKTMSAAAIYAETSPFTGTFTSLGTTYRNIQPGIAGTTSGAFRLRAIIPAGQGAGTYSGTLRVVAIGSGTSNVVTMPISVEVTDTLRRLEDTASPGTQVANITVPQAIMGQTSTTTQSFAGVIFGSPGPWSLQASMSATTMSNGSGNTMATTAVYVESAPTTGTFTSMGTTYRNVQTGIAAGTLTTGAFRLRVVVPANQAAGTYTGTLRVRATTSGTSNIITVPLSVTVVSTLEQVELNSAPGTSASAFAMPFTVKGLARASSDSLRAKIAGIPGGTWSVQARIAETTLTTSGGATMASTLVYVETSPFTGTYTSLGTTYRTVQSGIAAATSTSGFFRIRVNPLTTQPSGTYSGTLQIRTTSVSGVSNVVSLPFSIEVKDTLERLEMPSAAGTGISSYTLPEGNAPGTVTTVDTFRAVLNGSYAAWTLQARIAETQLVNSVTGDTMPSTAVYAETSPFTGTFTSLGTTYRTIQSGIPMATLTSGAFRLRAVIPGGQRSGSYSGTLNVQITNGTTSNVLAVPITVGVTASMTMGCVSTSASCAAPVTSVTFGETAPGASSAAQGPYRVNITSTTNLWAISAAVTTPFTDVGTGASLPDSAIEVQGVLQGAGWAPLSSSVLMQSGISNAVLSSSDFSLRLSPPVGQDSGLFEGVVTITAAVP